MAGRGEAGVGAPATAEIPALLTSFPPLATHCPCVFPAPTPFLPVTNTPVMPAPITLRHFDPQHDHAAVVELWTTVFGYGAAHNDPEFAIHQKLAVDDELFFVAGADVAVVGTVLAGYDGHRGWIYSLAVRPDHRQRGIGLALLRAAEQALALRGCVKVNLQVVTGNATVVGFYEKAGYAVEPRISMGRLLNR